MGTQSTTRPGRREAPRFAALDALRRGLAPPRVRRIDRWFPPRQFVILSAARTTVLHVPQRLQLGAVALCALGLLGFSVALIDAAWSRYAADRLSAELAELQRTARLEVERAANDRTLVGRLGPELAQCFAERDRATAATLVDGQLLARQRIDIDRLIAAREAAIEHGIAQRDAAIEDAMFERRLAIDRAIVERNRVALERDIARGERDRALAERDAALTDNREVLSELGARTESTINRVESIIASAGLGVGRAIKLPATKVQALPRGGPFIPWREQPVPVSAVEAPAIRGVASGLDRLQALRDFLVHLPLASPLAQAELLGGFGFRSDPFTGRAARHEGIDLRGGRDNAIYATADGIVSFAGWKSEFGNLVEIDHGFGLSTRYAHLSKLVVKTGEFVALHQQLGLIGATGRATAVHLHYEVRVDGQASNPINFLEAGRHVPEKDRHTPEQVSAASRGFSGFHQR